MNDSHWRSLFTNWPENMSRRGIVVTTLNEAITFKGFMIKEQMLLIERQNPDALGARFVMLQFDAIAAVKLVDPLKAEDFAPLGFQGRLSLG